MKIEAMLGRIFLVLVSSLLGLLLLDYASTWFVSTRSPIEQEFPVQYARQPHPYTMFGGKPNAKNLNSLGYKGKTPIVPKAPDEVRIILFGGSTVFFGEPPIAKLLEREFWKNKATNVRVYNFGVVSSVSGMELARLVYSASDLQPDLVIFYNGGNDILHPWSWDPRPGYPFNFVAYESNPLLESDVNEYPAITMFAYGSNIARYLFPNYFVNQFAKLDALRNEAGWKSEYWKEEIANIYVGNLSKADLISRAIGAQFVAFFQPMVYSKNALTSGEELIIDREKMPYVLDMQARIGEKIGLSENETPLLIDISHIYDNVPEAVFADEIHTRQAAKNIVAKKIYSEIIDNKLID